MGQAGKPKAITGFATHTTPVLVAHDQVLPALLLMIFFLIRSLTMLVFVTHVVNAMLMDAVFLAREQRAELASEQYLALTSVLEGFVILKPNPDWKSDSDKASPSKKKVRLPCVPCKTTSLLAHGMCRV